MATDEFGGVAVAEKPVTDEFGGVAVAHEDATGPVDVAVAKMTYPSLGSVLSAMGHHEGFTDNLGLSGLPPEAVKWLSDKGIFGPEKGGYQNPFQAMNEMLGHAVVGAVQIGARTVNAIIEDYQREVSTTGEQLSGTIVDKGMQALGLGGTAQLGRDLAAMPEAFFGSPHPLGTVKARSGLPRNEPVGVPANPMLGPAGFDAYHGSPHSFEAFSAAHIGTGEGAAAYGHGLYFAEHEGTAKDYQRVLGRDADAFRIDGKLFEYPSPEYAAASVIHKLDMTPAQALKNLGDSENLADVRAVLEKWSGKKPEISPGSGSLYQVRINADPSLMLDWDKPVTDKVVLDRVMAAANEIKPGWYDRLTESGKDLAKWALTESGIPKTGESIYGTLKRGLGSDQAASEALSRAGVPGIKYLDQGSRIQHQMEISGRADGWHVVAKLKNIDLGPFATREEAVQAAQNHGTRNFVIFNERDVQITHKNGEPIPTPLDHINEARDLGVIGPPKPDMTGMPPAARAAAEVPPPSPAYLRAAGRADEVIRGPEPGGPEKAGNIRLDQIGINAEAKDVVLEAARNNDDFNQARAGNVPLSQVESLSGASGVPSEILTGNSGLGRLMHNDAVVRTWLQAFHQATDEIAAQMRTVANTGEEADIAKLREMKLRFQHMQEQVSGLTAEAGRTLAVFREFYENKGKAEALGKVLEDNPGMDTASIKKLADAGRGLNDPAAVARLLHHSNKPTFWDKYLYYWVNALISGPVTHTKYVFANAAFGAYEALAVTPVAGALGTVRRLAGGGTEGVYVGEAAARMWGLIAGTPDALKASWYAARDNMMTPFPNEVLGKAVNPLTQTRPNPIGGKLGFAIGIPGRSAAGIHSFFRWLGYRAEIEAQAYRAAAKEGLSPTEQAFWERRASLADSPTDAIMTAAIENGNHLTFIGEQGQFGQAMSRLANTRFGESGIQPFKLILPFTHIPGQIMRASLEQTPLAFLDTKMRADLLGRNGAVAADTARARLIAGGAVAGMVANWAVGDTVTGFGPTDPSERARWLRTHEPYSVRLGGWWYSYNKFGPIGNLVGLIANLVEVGPKVHEGEYTEAAGRVIKATAHIMTDEVGMQGLINLIEALEEPDRKMGRFVAGQAASNLPYSSLLRQGASVTDPNLREAKDFVDQLRYQIPFARQDLLPKRDWLGEPMTNPGYGSIIRQRAENADPIDLAVSQLRGFRPAPPQRRVGGVDLPPKLYDEYVTTAGAMSRVGLESIVTSPGWGEIPPGIREQVVHSIVENARKTAGSMLQARHPELIMQGIQDRQDKINGVKKTKLKDRP